MSDLVNIEHFRRMQAVDKEMKRIAEERPSAPVVPFETKKERIEREAKDRL